MIYLIIYLGGIVGAVIAIASDPSSFLRWFEFKEDEVTPMLAGSWFLLFVIFWPIIMFLLLVFSIANFLWTLVQRSAEHIGKWLLRKR